MAPNLLQKGTKMESLRDVRRKMEREIEKGRATPLKFEYMSIEKDAYNEIKNEEMLKTILNWMLRLNEYRTGEATVINNVYSEMKPFVKEPKFVRTKSIIERMVLQANTLKYIRNINPSYDGNVFVEECECSFSLPDDELGKCSYKTKDGKDTYAFIMSDKYIMGLFCMCEAERLAFAKNLYDDVNEEEYLRNMMGLKNIKDVLFQCFLLDEVWEEGEYIKARLYTIYHIHKET